MSNQTGHHEGESGERSVYVFESHLTPWEACINVNFANVRLAPDFIAACTRDHLTLLTLSTSAANHDPAAYHEPWTFDITAEREPHSTFGGGPHYCLGASLARAEMQEALPILAEAMSNLAPDGEPTWRAPMGIFGPETLPIRFGHD